MSGFSDESLLKAMPVLKAYSRKLFWEIDRADDLLQETLDRALQKQHLFKTGNQRDLQSWLCMMMHNLWATKYKYINREVVTDPNPAERTGLARSYLLSERR